MDVNITTDGLRSLAPKWSLAGDEKLLQLLQTVHQNIISKCQDVNNILNDMTMGLDESNISLQNVNNRFMGLSNSQFIESRVYEDESDLAPQPTEDKEPPKPLSSPLDINRIKKSLSLLESAHEAVTILSDSDSDSDTDDDRIPTVVLKLKDLYSNRPLPYIIGSQQWKEKWHAGLIVEDSDSDISSKNDIRSPEYSESETEDINVRTDKPDVTISASNSDLQSEPEVPVSPAAVAAELARRLAGNIPQVQETEPEYETQPKPVVKTVYKPEVPQPAAIFFDEPPPLGSSSSHEDIFAELHKNKPNIYRNKDVADDLFDFNNDDGFVEKIVPPLPKVVNNIPETDKEKPNLVIPPKVEPIGTKKPIGGISVFGASQSDSIGAAILKRKQRTPSTSGSENESEIKNIKTDTKNTDQIDSIKKDILNDLFSKEKTKVEEKPIIIEKPKVDIFSDNLFDDIDDIFTNDIKIAKDKKDTKPIFDDEDELFSEVSAPKTTIAKEKDKKQSLFDSDDELFNETIQNTVKTAKTEVKESIKTTQKSIKSIFDSDSDNDIFSNINISKTKKDNLKVNDENKKYQSPSLFSDDDDLNEVKTQTVNNKPEIISNSKIEPGTSKQEVAQTVTIDNSKVDTKNSNIQDSIKDTKEKETNLTINKETNKEIDLNKKPEDLNKNKTVLSAKDSHTIPSETPSIKTKIIENEEKPIFSDDDELFSNKTTNLLEDPKSISDNDDIFSKIPTEKNISKIETKQISSDENDDIFSNIPKNKTKTNISNTDAKNTKQSKTTLDDDIFFNTPEPETKQPTKDSEIPISDEDDIFSKIPTEISKLESQDSKTTKEIAKDSEEISDDDIFSNISTVKTSKANISSKIEMNSDEELFTNIPKLPKEITKTEVAPKETSNLPQSVPKSDISKNESTISKETIKAEASETTEKLINKDEIISEPKTSKIDDIFSQDATDDFLSKDPTDDINSKDHTEDTLSKDQIDDVFSDSETFGKILTEPPVFEKKEPRTSNINALFEDDSEDEGFFKKSEVLDEKPEDFAAKDLFLFRDEPPELDFNEKTNLEINVNEIDDLFKAEHSKTNQKQEKSINKLKNIPIDVTKLLPGASPIKKNVPKVEISVQKELNPEILDSTISKQRAKIQVKRRPSSRKARKEAVRKSILEDTMNPTSFDIPEEINKQKITKVVYILNDEDLFKTEDIENNIITKTQSSEEKIDSEIAKTPTSCNIDKVLDEKSNKIHNVIDQKSHKIYNVLDEKSNKIDSENAIETPTSSKIDNVLDKKSIFGKIESKSTKLFDSDDDEDLFGDKNTKEINKNKNKVEIKKSLFDSDDDSDDLFRSAKNDGKPTTVKSSKEIIKTTKPVREDPLSLFGDDE